MWSNQTDGSDSPLVEKGLDNDMASTIHCSHWYPLNITSEVMITVNPSKARKGRQRVKENHCS